MSKRFLALLLFSPALLAACSLSARAGENPGWIWGTVDRKDAQKFCLYRRMDFAEAPLRAVLSGGCDFCRGAIYVNGTRVQGVEPYSGTFEAECASLLHPGDNVVGVCAESTEGPAAAFLILDVEFTNGERQTISTGGDWQSIPLWESDLSWPTLSEAKPAPVAELGEVERFPWLDRGESLKISPLDDYTQWMRARPAEGTASEVSFLVPEGFEVELVRSARPQEGSWIGLAFDPQGRAVIAQERQGLLRLTLSGTEHDRQAPAERINSLLHECRGLSFAHGSLYAMANNDRSLFRLQDLDGDDRWETVTSLQTLEGWIGHGRNEITEGPDGRLYAIVGDDLEEMAHARRRYPELSHPTRIEQHRSGFLASCNSEGKDWEVLPRGMRNPYGVAFNRDGEAFTYDADAEYDMGAPWYRPTRVVHLVSGGDFGWRAVTGLWPPAFPDRPDMPPKLLDIGKGSPTAIEFGYGSGFPPDWREALFILDWAYGRIIAVHLTPRGSGYQAGTEIFLRGRPANVTDVEFGPDGQMYFVTGGRGTQSALYRVRYSGPVVSPGPKTRQAEARERHAGAARARRRELERFHGKNEAAALDSIWPDLACSDPGIQHAARVALEWQPCDSWQSRALAETDPTRALQALLALTRVGPESILPTLSQRLTEFPLKLFSKEQLACALFIWERCVEGGGLSSDQIQLILDHCQPLYPGKSATINRPLSMLLKRLGSAQLIEQTLPLLESAAKQEDQLHFLLVLRDVREGWTPETRQRFFTVLAATQTYVGGEGMPRFRRLLEEESLAALPEEERGPWTDFLARAATPQVVADEELPPRPVVREWSLEDLRDSVGEITAGRDFARGELAFSAGQCVRCHRLNGRGGSIGPDLTSISSRFTPLDVLTSIVEPSRVISDTYRNQQYVLRDGRVVTGRVLPGGDYRSPSLRVGTDPLDPQRIVEFPKGDVEQAAPSDVSPMPTGLLNTLTRDEILDLLAYLHAAGNRRHPCFRAQGSSGG